MTTVQLLTIVAAILEAGQRAHGTTYSTPHAAVEDAAHMLKAAERITGERRPA